MNSTAVVNNIVPSCEASDTVTCLGGPRSKSSADKGQVFADSPSLVKVRKEAESHKNAGSDTAGGEQSGQSEGSSADSASSAKVECSSTAATRGQHSQRRSKVTEGTSEPDAGTSVTGEVAVLIANRPDLTEPAPAAGSDQPVQADTGGLPMAMDQPQACQASTASTVQGKGLECSTPVVLQPGQTPVDNCQSAVAAKAEGQTDVHPADPSLPTLPTTASSADTKNATPTANHSTVPSDPHPQAPATGMASVEAQKADPPAADVSDKAQVSASEQVQAQGSRPLPSAQTKPQVEAPPAPPAQTEGGSSRQLTVKQAPTMPLLQNKNDMQILQNGQDAQLATQSSLSSLSQDAPVDSSSTASAQPSTSASGETVLLKDPSRDLSEQLGGALKAGLDRPDKQLLVRLHPPELGSVLVRFEEQGQQQIHAVLEVSRAETGRDIEQALPQVIKNLQDAGLHVRKFDVVVSDQTGKDTGSSSSSHDAWGQQQAWSQSGSRPDSAPRSAWSPWSGQHQSHFDSGDDHALDNTAEAPTGIDLLA